MTKVKTKICPRCDAPLDPPWGRLAFKAKQRIYCSSICRRRASSKRARIIGRDNGSINAHKTKVARETRGRRCKWPHCGVDDEHHVKHWSSPLDTCPTCDRQLRRKPPCKRCGGPQYANRAEKSLHCPTCKPRQPKPGEVTVVLVCSATGQEREIIRRPDWVCPDGRSLAKAHDEGFLVIDVAPEIWAKYRA
jgi:hypothetical protein